MKKYPKILKHGYNELKLADYLHTNDEYNYAIGKAVLQLLNVIGKQQHSGMSINIVKTLFNKLSDWQNITPLKRNRKEWYDVSQVSNLPKNTIWQNKRNPACFSNNQGKTFFNVNKQIKEQLIKEIYNNSIIGGKGDNYNINDVNPFELAVGIKVEREHTINKQQMTEIAIDHLIENKNYYTILLKSGVVDEYDAINTFNKLKKINKYLLIINTALKNKQNKNIDKYIKQIVYQLTFLIPYNFYNFITHKYFKTENYKYAFNYIIDNAMII